ncbi:serine-rich adhesin for platelets-like [Lytechinus pictus]|uniref:serine-rich adhesin for platelets-like n=1 Tax=Lytechinus pictus TaxID=7653 RepID=UPI0030B9B0F7
MMVRIWLIIFSSICHLLQISADCAPPILTVPGLYVKPDAPYYEKHFVLYIHCEASYIKDGDDFTLCIKEDWIPDPSLTACHGKPTTSQSKTSMSSAESPGIDQTMITTEIFTTQPSIPEMTTSYSSEYHSVTAMTTKVIDLDQTSGGVTSRQLTSSSNSFTFFSDLITSTSAGTYTTFPATADKTKAVSLSTNDIPTILFGSQTDAVSTVRSSTDSISTILFGTEADITTGDTDELSTITNLETRTGSISSERSSTYDISTILLGTQTDATAFERSSTDDITTRTFPTERSSTSGISSSIPLSTHPLGTLDTDSYSQPLQSSTDPYNIFSTIGPSDISLGSKAQDTTTSQITSETFTSERRKYLSTAIPLFTDKKIFTVGQSDAYSEQQNATSTGGGVPEDDATTTDVDQQKTGALRTSKNPTEELTATLLVTSHGRETFSNWWGIFLGSVGSGIILWLLVAIVGFIFTKVLKESRKWDQLRFKNDATLENANPEPSVIYNPTYNPTAITHVDNTYPVTLHY